MIRTLEGAGWVWHSTTGSHRHFKHPSKPGKITIPHPKKDMHPKTVKAILKAAGL
ncbi:type II toxin-antitoxin system HicA family toxin [Methylobacterium sp. J-026]|uniref:type II toxin-antitoxin system HicA family toxin n=1 Tax=Methylobacterium sp. J-026 TaxID=2836624 RepID=UPI001FB9F07E|nr:type II toxin-antitoxin system HicA family toxin [Methylobacterium sp. J-026]MCJ2132622.1 type II toxin-antitoxin system HicA family toxin [Methylobacterium sp. J-026]